MMIPRNVSERRQRRNWASEKGTSARQQPKALEHWVKQQTQEEIAHDALALLKTGHHLGRHLYTERKDLYDRTTGSY
jgi:hypothetical protein